MPGQSADAAQIQALLGELSRVRLAVSADLSAAAGALDDSRPDIASDMVGGARRELADLLDPGRRGGRSPRRAADPDAHAGTGEPAVPAEPKGRQPSRRIAKALASAAALTVAIAVVPQVIGGGHHPATGTTAAAPSPSIVLASSDFATLSQRLTAADASPAAILAAGQRWQSALSRDLPAVASRPSTAATAVTMLRLERTLLQVSPTLRAPQNRAVAATLVKASDTLLTKLRELANPQVLAVLPAAIQALPISGATKPAPHPGSSPAPAATAAAAPGVAAQPAAPALPAAGGTPPASSGPLPVDPGKVLPVPQVPLPSTLGQLTGGGTQSGGLSQTVGNVLSGLGLGG